MSSVANSTLAPPLTARLVVIADDGSSYTLEDFIKYEFNNDIFTPCDDFSFTFAVGGRNSRFTAKDVRAINAIVKKDSVVRLELGEDRVLSGTGIIGKVNAGGNKATGLLLEVTGRDGMQLLVDNTVQPGLKVSNATLPEVADAMLKRYRGNGIDYKVISDNSSNRNIMSGKRYGEKRFHDYNNLYIRTTVGLVATREVQQPDTFVPLPIDEGKPHEGEKEYQFLERHASNLGVMLWFTCDGNLYIGRPADGLPPAYRLQRRIEGDTLGNNIIDGGRRQDSEGAWTSVKCLGHSSGRGDYKTQVKATAHLANPGKWPRDHVVHDANAKTTGRAEKIALRALGRAATNLDALEYTVQGFGQAGMLYTPDMVADVDDEWSVAKGLYYTTGRTIKGNRGTGEMTTMRLVPVGTITL